MCVAINHPLARLSLELLVGHTALFVCVCVTAGVDGQRINPSVNHFMGTAQRMNRRLGNADATGKATHHRPLNFTLLDQEVSIHEQVVGSLGLLFYLDLDS